jgi:N-acetylglucosaminyl-diphospho-decaprenol L-rhamnosyltransferase
VGRASAPRNERRAFESALTLSLISDMVIDTAAPRLAVVIVSWNVRDMLGACLRSLFADLDRSGLEAQVWVVDNASSDGTPAMVAEEFPEVRLIASDENLGFAAGNDLALRGISNLKSQAPKYIWLLNPDAEVLPGATAALLAALEADPRAAVAGAKLLYPDGSLQPSAFRFPGLVQLAFEFFSLPSRFYDTPLNGRYPRRLYEREAPFPVDHPLGAAMMVRMGAVAQVGLMDEGYWMYCEEIDWCWRMRRAGWHALCVPAARVVHRAGRSTTQVPVRSFTNLWISRARLYARHHGPVTHRLARAMVRAGMRRRMRGASPEMIAACRQVIHAWEEGR